MSYILKYLYSSVRLGLVRVVVISSVMSIVEGGKALLRNVSVARALQLCNTTKLKDNRTSSFDTPHIILSYVPFP